MWIAWDGGAQALPVFARNLQSSFSGDIGPNRPNSALRLAPSGQLGSNPDVAAPTGLREACGHVRGLISCVSPPPHANARVTSPGHLLWGHLSAKGGGLCDDATVANIRLMPCTPVLCTQRVEDAAKPGALLTR